MPGRYISAHWEDIVYFQNGKIPKIPTKMYTEGVFVEFRNGVIVIDNPETLLFAKGKKVKNHPEKQPRRYHIPIQLITQVTQYA